QRLRADSLSHGERAGVRGETLVRFACARAAGNAKNYCKDRRIARAWARTRASGAGCALADIFISYAQKAPEPTQSLAAELAALKYSVWFDQRLLPVDTFIEVINHELDAAKAVITIWSPPALESRWVKAEASRAAQRKKLINVHTPDVSPGNLPVPFNIEHVEPIAHRAKIFEALAKLGVHPGGAAPVEKAAREAGE